MVEFLVKEFSFFIRNGMVNRRSRIQNNHTQSKNCGANYIELISTLERMIKKKNETNERQNRSNPMRERIPKFFVSVID